MKKSQTKGTNFEEALRELEEIVGQLEAGDLPLEQSLALFEQGVRLARHCQQQLDEAERRVEVLLRGEDGRPLTAPFEEFEE